MLVVLSKDSTPSCIPSGVLCSDCRTGITYRRILWSTHIGMHIFSFCLQLLDGCRQRCISQSCLPSCSGDPMRTDTGWGWVGMGHSAAASGSGCNGLTQMPLEHLYLMGWDPASLCSASHPTPAPRAGRFSHSEGSHCVFCLGNAFFFFFYFWWGLLPLGATPGLQSLRDGVDILLVWATGLHIEPWVSHHSAQLSVSSFLSLAWLPGLSSLGKCPMYMPKPSAIPDT